MQIKGIKRGKTIELANEPNIPDGREILIDINDAQLTSPEEQRKSIMEFLAQPWEGREDFLKTMEELEREKEAEWEKLYGHLND
ncbi:MAG: hypothetical protein F6J93_00280 [Oscillatoria sp. SIO1A7]|nr:hypothetical protein [Oscillatoria sp. SIO1A7]